MMKKLYAVMAAALLLCGLLTACGSKDSGKTYYFDPATGVKR